MQNRYNPWKQRRLAFKEREMARSARQSKILELISTKEIETQDELARET